MLVLSASKKISSNDNATIWHAELGHVNISRLKIMVQKDLINGLPKLTNFGGGEACEGCQYGKSHRLPFDKSLSRCKAPLEVVHSDLRGPTRNPSFSGFHYVLL